MYIYSESEKNKVNIRSCTFRSNSLLSSSSGTLKGSSVIYLTLKEGCIEDCHFYGDGKDILIQVVNDFNGGRNTVHLSNERNNANLTISRCIIDNTNSAMNSIFYHSGSPGSSVLVVNCNFIGKLIGGFHYIDGELLKSDMANFHIKSCKVDHRIKSAAKFKFIDQSEIKKSDVCLSSKYLVTTVSFLAVFAIASVALFVRAKIIKAHENENSDCKSIEEIEESNN